MGYVQGRSDAHSTFFFSEMDSMNGRNTRLEQKDTYRIIRIQEVGVVNDDD